MDPMSIAAIAGAAGTGLNILLNGIGSALSAGDRDKAKALYEEAAKRLESAGLPPNLSGPVVLQQLKSAGTLTPEKEQAFTDLKSEIDSYKEDKSLRDAQSQALSRMISRGAEGFDAQGKASLNKALSEAAGQQRAAQAQIQQQAAQRGMAGGGSELAARMLAQQAGADQGYNQALNIGALSDQRALEAIAQSATLGGQMRQQDFGQASDIARAKDVMAQFNRQNAASREARNVASQNQANQWNLSNQQQVMNQNAEMANKESYRQKEAERQYWQDKLSNAQIGAQASKMQGDVYAGQAAATQQAFGQVGAGITGLAGTLGGAAIAGRKAADPEKTTQTTSTTPAIVATPAARVAMPESGPPRAPAGFYPQNITPQETDPAADDFRNRKKDFSFNQP